MAWVAWEHLCRSKDEGGLGFRDLGKFNSTLLARWIWRFLNGENNIWSRGVRSRFGALTWGRNGERFNGNGKRREGWWKSVVDGVAGRDGCWFWDKLKMKLGDGKDACFWDGMWSGSRSLKDMFPRLYTLCTKKDGKVADMGEWEEGIWRWNFEWRRLLRECEKEWERNLLIFLQGARLTEGLKDMWIWSESGDNEYSVKKAYNELSKSAGQTSTESAAAKHLSHVWRDGTPFKAQVTSWRLLLDRLPTKMNLLKRNLTSNLNPHCSCCKSEVEAADHLFFNCPDITALWNKIVA